MATPITDLKNGYARLPDGSGTRKPFHLSIKRFS